MEVCGGACSFYSGVESSGSIGNMDCWKVGWKRQWKCWRESCADEPRGQPVEFVRYCMPGAKLKASWPTVVRVCLNMCLQMCAFSCARECAYSIATSIAHTSSAIKSKTKNFVTHIVSKNVFCVWIDDIENCMRGYFQDTYMFCPVQRRL